MRTVFADTAYWIALLNPKDELHERAQEVSKSLGAIRIFTTEMVLVELLNYFANPKANNRARADRRKAATALAKTVRDDPNVTVIPQTSIQFREGLKLYEDRPDKAWTQTDCCSFKVMEKYRIREALTYDKHFEQAGFVALLREDDE
ncbi:MAG: type II toxin-antitoxin system VapC family toxin [Planctomycetes bacterium]|nr:type II toxin-antitoxin system VapC family toxin [Planctomycetota bacterium]